MSYLRSRHSVKTKRVKVSTHYQLKAVTKGAGYGKAGGNKGKAEKSSWKNKKKGSL